METAFIIWYCVVILVCAIIIARIIVAVSQHKFHHHKKATHIVQMSNEREMLYIPGDNLNMDGSDQDYNPDDM